jgi:hypothetical protein
MVREGGGHALDEPCARDSSLHGTNNAMAQAPTYTAGACVQYGLAACSCNTARFGSPQ